MNLKYYLGAFLTIPLLPLMYIQGKKIRASVPNLPEAKGHHGKIFISEDDINVKDVIVIGESTMAGIGVNTHKEGFAGTLASELSKLLTSNVNWKVYAKSGFSAKMVGNLIIPGINDSKVDLFVIGLGGNDAFNLTSPRSWRRDVRKIIYSLNEKFPGTPIVFANMPPIKGFPAFTSLIKFVVGNLVEMLGQELSKVVKEYENVYYYERVITLEDWINRLGVSAPESDFFSDGVHPSKLTYQIWAKDLAHEIKNLEIFES